MTDTNEPWLEPLARAIRSAWGDGPVVAARAAYAELQRQGQIGIPDNPGLDATDGAHPAWWRGEEYGAKSVVREMLKAFTGPRHDGKFSMPEMNELREKIWALRENQRTPGTMEICSRSPERCSNYYKHQWCDCTHEDCPL